MDDADRIARTLDALAAELRAMPPSVHWINQFRDGEMILSGAAAEIADVSEETVRRRCKDSESSERPCGFLIASVWLISLQRWLDDIEERKGLHARRVAESRAKKLSEMRRSPQQSPGNRVATTG
jgi:hypothetical protein